MYRHRGQRPKDVVLEHDQRLMSFFVLHVQAMMAAVSGKTAITQQRTDKNRSLSVGQVVIRTRTSLGVILKHGATVVATCDRTFADTAGLFISVTAHVCYFPSCRKTTRGTDQTVSVWRTIISDDLSLLPVRSDYVITLIWLSGASV